MGNKSILIIFTFVLLSIGSWFLYLVLPVAASKAIDNNTQDFINKSQIDIPTPDSTVVPGYISEQALMQILKNQNDFAIQAMEKNNETMKVMEIGQTAMSVADSTSEGVAVMCGSFIALFVMAIILYVKLKGG